MATLQQTTVLWIYSLDFSSSYLCEKRDFFEQIESDSHA